MGVRRLITTDLIVKAEVKASKVKNFSPEESKRTTPISLQNQLRKYLDNDWGASNYLWQVV
ncbi:hypothetical protein DPMN_043801 [Dreissena polymorpha]|uniref:Uncharacterized protein n=1 Tax=Dreissena polymorpha TaxID=45954 RepID=A0A9D4D308_DREPO|nr:hypothetical protein DPMN_043801 [Dreissena polymorpha]